VADPRETLIRNEQAKLTATYLNGIAIALAAVGGIAPLVAFAQGSTPGSVLLIVSPACWCACFGLHFRARRTLRKLAI